MNPIGQEDVISFLKRNKGSKFTADELQKFLDLGAGAYGNLQRLRPKCASCMVPIRGTPLTCNWCGWKIEWKPGVRCVKAHHKKDPRRDVYFYWYEK